MSNSFIQRLTDEQIKDFLIKYYPNYKVHNIIRFKEDNSIFVQIAKSQYSNSVGYKLYNFNSTLAFPSIWIKYLYSIFGEEYKKAYIDNCLKVFDD